MIDRNSEQAPIPQPQDIPEKTPAFLKLFRRKKNGRRTFIEGSGEITAGAAAAITIASSVNGYLFGRFTRAGIDIFNGNRDKIEILKEVLTFLNPPTPEQLLAECYNREKEVVLTPEQMQNAAWYVFGDSMNLSYGLHAGAENSKNKENIVKENIARQKNSWAQIIVDGVNRVKTRLGIKDTNGWHAYNLARLGSSTLGLVGNDPNQTDGNVQLGNKNVQKILQNEEGKPIVAVGLNGNNWRETAAYVINLYNKDEEFRHFLATIDPKKDIKEIIKDCIQLMTPHLSDELENIFKLNKKNAKEFADGFRQAVNIVDQINEKRKKAKKEEITLVTTLPINLGLRDIVPYAPPKSMNRGSYSFTDVPNSREAIFRITTTIYQSANQILRDYDQRKGKDKMQAITVPFFGAEQYNNLFAQDGHFNPNGEKFIALRILSCFSTNVIFPRLREQIKVKLSDIAQLQTEPQNPPPAPR